VLLKVDSGPGRLNVDMLADRRLHGLYLVPGVPNTTHHTQETDQNYGIYKSSFRENLRLLSQCRFENLLTLQVCDLPLLVFGGECPSTGLLLRDAFSDAFSVERNLSCWKKCGAVPLTMAPLHTKHIRHEVPVGAAVVEEGQPEDDGVQQLRDLENINKFYCDLLTANGYDGSQLRKEAPTRSVLVAVTEANSRERVLAIKAAKTAGQLFHATGGRHLNSDDFFRARALAERDCAIKEVEQRKKALLKAVELENNARHLLTRKGNLVPENERNFNVADLKLLLKWKKVKASSFKKADLVMAYYNNPSPPNVQPWSDEDEMKLVALRSEDIDMKDTALGVATAQMARAVQQNLANLDPETRAQLKKALDDDGDDGLTGIL
jgi:hypothetical protein